MYRARETSSCSAGSGGPASQAGRESLRLGEDQTPVLAAGCSVFTVVTDTGICAFSAVSVAVSVTPRLLCVPPVAFRGRGGNEGLHGRSLKTIRPSGPRHYSGEWAGQLLAPPPCAGGALGGAVGEPVLPQHASRESVERRQRILSKECEDAGLCSEQSFLRNTTHVDARHARVTRTRGSTRSVADMARKSGRALTSAVCAKRIRDPRSPPSSSFLKFNLVSCFGHAGEQPVLVRDSERRSRRARAGVRAADGESAATVA
jgi:hypothetical protein